MLFRSVQNAQLQNCIWGFYPDKYAAVFLSYPILPFRHRRALSNTFFTSLSFLLKNNYARKPCRLSPPIPTIIWIFPYKVNAKLQIRHGQAPLCPESSSYFPLKPMNSVRCFLKKRERKKLYSAILFVYNVFTILYNGGISPI